MILRGHGERAPPSETALSRRRARRLALDTGEGLATSQPPAMTTSAPLGPIVVGTVFGDRYEVRQMGGKCSMGTEMLGVDRLTHLPVQLEVVDQLSDTPGDIELLRREMMEVRPIVHPNVCRVLDAVPSPWGLVMVTEPWPGQTLHTHIRKKKARGGYTSGELRRIASGTCRGLAAIHARGIVHGDIKPDNVMVGERGVAIVDCGFLAERARTSARRPGAMSEDGGTPSYMSPERRRGGGPSVADDVRALSLSLWEMLTYRVPEPGAEPRTTRMRPALVFGLPEGLLLDEMRQIFRALHDDPLMRPAAQDFRFASPERERYEIPARSLLAGDLFRAELDEDALFTDWAEAPWTGVALELHGDDGQPVLMPERLDAITKDLVSGMGAAMNSLVPFAAGWIRPTRTLVSLVGVTHDAAPSLLERVLPGVEASVPDGTALAAMIVPPSAGIPGEALYLL